MRKNLLVAGFAVAALIPSLAMAQQTCEQRSANRTAGTAVGAVAGALLGSAVAGHHDRGTGAVIGGIGGAVVGNQLARGDRDCVHAYGWYDDAGRWHANSVDRSVATGYYDRSGQWIDGQPNGYYDSRGVWVANGGVYGRDASYDRRANTWEIDTQINRVADRIQRGRADGSLSSREARRADQQLNDIRRDEQYQARDGRLDERERAALMARLDDLSTQVRMDRYGSNENRRDNDHRY
jgi:hypothetical protein